MIRATPYWSVSPMATRAYMPPSVTPDNNASLNINDYLYTNHGGHSRAEFAAGVR